MDAETKRRLNINYLATKYGRHPLAEKLGYTDTNYINQLCGNFGSFGKKVARKIETSLALDHGWMDNLHPELYNPDDLLSVRSAARISDAAGPDYALAAEAGRIMKAVERLSPEKKRRILSYIEFELAQDDAAKDTP